MPRGDDTRYDPRRQVTKDLIMGDPDSDDDYEGGSYPELHHPATFHFAKSREAAMNRLEEYEHDRSMGRY